MLNSNNRIKLYSVISTFILISIIFVMLGFRKKIFHETNKTSKMSLEQGHGYYDQPVSLGCITEDNLCNKPGTETFVQKCIPHPDTGKGCFNEETGTMTFKSKTTTKSCTKDCVKQSFTLTQSEDFETESSATKDTTKDNTTKKLFYKGVNNVIDPYYGIDYTDEYFGDYNASTNTYAMKTDEITNYPICIPKEYTGYYQRKYTCNSHDSVGTDACKYTCGTDKTISFSGQRPQTNQNKDVIMRYPFFIEETGEKYYYCYDQVGNNLIAPLYESEKVDTNFVFPKVCYSRYITNFKQYHKTNSSVTYNSNYILLGDIITISDSQDQSINLPLTFTSDDNSLLFAKIGQEFMKVNYYGSGATITALEKVFILYSKTEIEDLTRLTGVSFDDYEYVYKINSDDSYSVTVDGNLTIGGLDTTSPKYGFFEGNSTIVKLTYDTTWTSNISIDKLNISSPPKFYNLDITSSSDDGSVFVTESLLLTGKFSDLANINDHTFFSDSTSVYTNQEIELNFKPLFLDNTVTTTKFVPYSPTIVFGGIITVDTLTETSLINIKQGINYTIYVDEKSKTDGTNKYIIVDRNFLEDKNIRMSHQKNTDVFFTHNLTEKVSDFTELMSPYIESGDQIINACYDDQNKKRPDGYVVNLQPGETLVANIESKDYNLDFKKYKYDSAECGVYGYKDSDGVVQPSHNNTDVYQNIDIASNPLECSISTDETTDNSKIENMFRLGISSDTSDNKLSCFSSFGKNSSDRACNIPNIPTKYSSNDSYEKGQIVYKELKNGQFYISMLDNNRSNLTKSDSWRQVNIFSTLLEYMYRRELVMSRNTSQYFNLKDQQSQSEPINFSNTPEFSFDVFSIKNSGVRTLNPSGVMNPYITGSYYFPDKYVDVKLNVTISSDPKYPFNSKTPSITKPFHMDLVLNKLLYRPNDVQYKTDTKTGIESRLNTWRKFGRSTKVGKYNSKYSFNYGQNNKSNDQIIIPFSDDYSFTKGDLIFAYKPDGTNYYPDGTTVTSLQREGSDMRLYLSNKPTETVPPTTYYIVSAPKYSFNYGNNDSNQNQILIDYSADYYFEYGDLIFAYKPDGTNYYPDETIITDLQLEGNNMRLFLSNTPTEDIPATRYHIFSVSFDWKSPFQTKNGDGNWVYGLRFDARPDIIFNHNGKTIEYSNNTASDYTEYYINRNGMREKDGDHHYLNPSDENGKFGRPFKGSDDKLASLWFKYSFITGDNKPNLQIIVHSDYSFAQGDLIFAYKPDGSNYYPVGTTITKSEPNSDGRKRLILSQENTEKIPGGTRYYIKEKAGVFNNIRKAFGGRFGIYRSGDIQSDLISLAKDINSDISNSISLANDINYDNSNLISLVTRDSDSVGAKSFSERWFPHLTNKVRTYFYPYFVPDSTSGNFGFKDFGILSEFTNAAELGSKMSFTIPKKYLRTFKIGNDNEIDLVDYNYTLKGNNYENHMGFNFFIENHYEYPDSNFKGDDNYITWLKDDSRFGDNDNNSFNLEIVPLFGSISVKDDTNVNSTDKINIAIDTDTVYSYEDGDNNHNKLITDYEKDYSTKYGSNENNDDRTQLWRSQSIKTNEIIIGRIDEGTGNGDYRLVMLQKNEDFSDLDLYFNYPRPSSVFSLPEAEPLAIRPSDYCNVYCYVNNIESLYYISEDKKYDTGFIHIGKNKMYFTNNTNYLPSLSSIVDSSNKQYWNKTYLPFFQSTSQTTYSRFSKIFPGKLIDDSWSDSQDPKTNNNAGDYLINKYKLNRISNDLVPIYGKDKSVNKYIWYTITNENEDNGNNGDTYYEIEKYNETRSFNIPTPGTTPSSNKTWQTYLSNLWSPPAVLMGKDYEFLSFPDSLNGPFSPDQLDENFVQYQNYPFYWLSNLRQLNENHNEEFYNDLIRSIFWGQTDIDNAQTDGRGQNYLSSPYTSKLSFSVNNIGNDTIQKFLNPLFGENQTQDNNVGSRNIFDSLQYIGQKYNFEYDNLKYIYDPSDNFGFNKKDGDFGLAETIEETDISLDRTVEPLYNGLYGQLKDFNHFYIVPLISSYADIDDDLGRSIPDNYVNKKYKYSFTYGANDKNQNEILIPYDDSYDFAQEDLIFAYKPDGKTNYYPDGTTITNIGVEEGNGVKMRLFLSNTPNDDIPSTTYYIRQSDYKIQDIIQDTILATNNGNAMMGNYFRLIYRQFLKHGPTTILPNNAILPKTTDNIYELKNFNYSLITLPSYWQKTKQSFAQPCGVWSMFSGSGIAMDYTHLLGNLNWFIYEDDVDYGASTPTGIYSGFDGTGEFPIRLFNKSGSIGGDIQNSIKNNLDGPVISANMLYTISQNSNIAFNDGFGDPVFQYSLRYSQSSVNLANALYNTTKDGRASERIYYKDSKWADKLIPPASDKNSNYQNYDPNYLTYNLSSTKSSNIQIKITYDLYNQYKEENLNVKVVNKDPSVNSPDTKPENNNYFLIPSNVQKGFKTYNLSVKGLEIGFNTGNVTTYPNFLAMGPYNGFPINFDFSQIEKFIPFSLISNDRGTQYVEYVHDKTILSENFDIYNSEYDMTLIISKLGDFYGKAINYQDGKDDLKSIFESNGELRLLYMHMLGLYGPSNDSVYYNGRKANGIVLPSLSSRPSKPTNIQYNYYGYKKGGDSFINSIPKPVRTMMDIKDNSTDAQQKLQTFGKNLLTYCSSPSRPNLMKIIDNHGFLELQTEGLNKNIGIPMNYFPGGWGWPSYLNDFKTLYVTHPQEPNFYSGKKYPAFPLFEHSRQQLHKDFTYDNFPEFINSNNNNTSLNSWINGFTESGKTISFDEKSKDNIIPVDISKDLAINGLSTSDPSKFGQLPSEDTLPEITNYAKYLENLIDNLYVNEKYNPGSMLKATPETHSYSSSVKFPFRTFYQLQSPRWRMRTTNYQPISDWGTSLSNSTKINGSGSIVGSKGANYINKRVDRHEDWNYNNYDGKYDPIDNSTNTNNYGKRNNMFSLGIICSGGHDEEFIFTGRDDKTILPNYTKDHIVRYIDISKSDKSSDYDPVQLRYNTEFQKLSILPQETKIRIPDINKSSDNTLISEVNTTLTSKTKGKVPKYFRYEPIISSPSQDPYMWNTTDNPVQVNMGLKNIGFDSVNGNYKYNFSQSSTYDYDIKPWASIAVRTKMSDYKETPNYIIDLEIRREDPSLHRKIFGYNKNLRSDWYDKFNFTDESTFTIGNEFLQNMNITLGGENIKFSDQKYSRMYYKTNSSKTDRTYSPYYNYYDDDDENHQIVTIDPTRKDLDDQYNQKTGEPTVPSTTDNMYQFFNFYLYFYKKNGGDKQTVNDIFNNTYHNNFSNNDKTSTFSNMYSNFSNLTGRSFIRQSNNNNIVTAYITPKMDFRMNSVNVIEPYKLNGTEYNGLSSYVSKNMYTDNTGMDSLDFIPTKSQVVKNIYGNDVPNFFGPGTGTNKGTWSIPGFTEKTNKIKNIGTLNYYNRFKDIDFADLHNIDTTNNTLVKKHDEKLSITTCSDTYKGILDSVINNNTNNTNNNNNNNTNTPYYVSDFTHTPVTDKKINFRETFTFTYGQNNKGNNKIIVPSDYSFTQGDLIFAYKPDGKTNYYPDGTTVQSSSPDQNDQTKLILTLSKANTDTIPGGITYYIKTSLKDTEINVTDYSDYHKVNPNDGPTYKIIAVTNLLNEDKAYTFENYVEPNSTGYNVSGGEIKEGIWHFLDIDESYDFNSMLFYRYTNPKSTNSQMIKSNFIREDGKLKMRTDVTDAWSNVNDVTPYNQLTPLGDTFLPAYGCLPMSGGKMVWSEITDRLNNGNENNGNSYMDKVKNYFDTLNNLEGDTISEYKLTRYTMSPTLYSNFENKSTNTFIPSIQGFNVGTIKNITVKGNFPELTDKHGIYFSKNFFDKSFSKIFGDIAGSLQRAINPFSENTSEYFYRSSNITAPSGDEPLTTIDMNFYNSGISDEDYDLNPKSDAKESDSINQNNLGEDIFFTREPGIFKVLLGYPEFETQPTTTDYSEYISYSKIQDITPPSVKEGTKYLSSVSSDIQFARIGGERFFYTSTYSTDSLEFRRDNNTQIFDGWVTSTYTMSDDDQSLTPKFIHDGKTITITDSTLDLRKIFDLPETTTPDTLVSTKIALNDIRNFVERLTPGDIIKIKQYKKDAHDYEIVVSSKVSSNPYAVKLQENFVNSTTGVKTLTSEGNDINIQTQFTYVYLSSSRFNHDGNAKNAITLRDMEFTDGVVLYNNNNIDDYEDFKVLSPSILLDFNITNSISIDNIETVYNPGFNIVLRVIDEIPSGIIDVFGTVRAILGPSSSTNYEINKTYRKYQIIYDVEKENVFFKAKNKTMEGDSPFEINSINYSTNWEMVNFDSNKIVENKEWQPYHNYKKGDVVYRERMLLPYINYNVGLTVSEKQKIVPLLPSKYPYKLFNDDYQNIQYYEAKSLLGTNQKQKSRYGEQENIIDPLFYKKYSTVDIVGEFKNDPKNIKEYGSICSTKNLVGLTQEKFDTNDFSGCDEPLNIYSETDGVISFDNEKIIANNFIQYITLGGIQNFTQTEISGFFDDTTTPFGKNTTPSVQNGTLTFITIEGSLLNLIEGEDYYYIDNTGNFSKINEQTNVSQNFRKCIINSDGDYYIIYEPFSTSNLTDLYYVSADTSPINKLQVNGNIKDSRIIACCQPNKESWSEYEVSPNNISAETFSRNSRDMYRDYKANFKSLSYITQTDDISNSITTPDGVILYYSKVSTQTNNNYDNIVKTQKYFVEKLIGGVNVYITNLSLMKDTTYYVEEEIDGYDIKFYTRGSNNNITRKKPKDMLNIDTVYYSKINYNGQGPYYLFTYDGREGINFSQTKPCMNFNLNPTTDDLVNKGDFSDILGNFVSAKVLKDDKILLLSLPNSPCNYSENLGEYPISYLGDCTADIGSEMLSQVVSYIPLEKDGDNGDPGLSGKSSCTGEFLGSNKFELSNSLLLYFVPLEKKYQSSDNKKLNCRIMTFFGTEFVGWLKYNRSIEVKRDFEVDLNTGDDPSMTPLFVSYTNLNILNTKKQTKVLLGNKPIHVDLYDNIEESNAYYTTNFKDEDIFTLVKNNGKYNIEKLSTEDNCFVVDGVITTGNYTRNSIENVDYPMVDAILTPPDNSTLEEGNDYLVNLDGDNDNHKRNGIYTYKDGKLVVHEDFNTFDKIVENQLIKDNDGNYYKLSMVVNELSMDDSGQISISQISNIDEFNNVNIVNVSQYYAFTPVSQSGHYIVNNVAEIKQNGYFIDSTKQKRDSQTIFQINSTSAILPNTYWSYDINAENIVFTDVTYMFNNLGVLTNRSNQLETQPLVGKVKFRKEYSNATAYGLNDLTLTPMYKQSDIVNHNNLITQLGSIRESRLPGNIGTENDCSLFFSFNPFSDDPTRYVYKLVKGTNDVIKLETVSSIIFDNTTTSENIERDLQYNFKYRIDQDEQDLNKGIKLSIRSNDNPKPKISVVVTYVSKVQFKTLNKETLNFDENGNQISGYSPIFPIYEKSLNGQNDSYILFEPIKNSNTTSSFSIDVKYGDSLVDTFTVS